MASPMQHIGKLFYGLSPSIFQPLRHYQRSIGRTYRGPAAFLPLRNSFCQVASGQAESDAPTAPAPPRYLDRPSDYLESEEYIERYGTNPIWTGYRRNHKGGIPPQKTRKTCIRGETMCGNPCPICRDPNAIVHYQNVKLLQQFINPNTGIVFDATRTGVCMKQQKLLNQAIDTARDHGLLSFKIPYVEFRGEEFSNSHDAVGSTQPCPSLNSGDSWYSWYSEIMPDEKEVAKVKKTYKAYLK